MTNWVFCAILLLFSQSEKVVQTGWGLIEAGNYIDAVGLFQRAVAQWPKDSEPHLGVAVAEAALGHAHEAEQALDRARKLARLSEDKLDYHVAAIRVYTLAKPSKNWLRTARGHYQDGIRIHPTFSALQYRMAQAYLEARDVRHARALFAQVVAIDGAFAAEASWALKGLP